MLTILIVDDEREIVESLFRLVRQEYGEGYEILKTNMSWAAKDILQTQVIDILLTDIRMPGLDGFALARIAKENNPDSHVIFLTGYQEFDYVYEAIKLGCDDFVLKVDSNEAILAAVQKAMERIQTAVEQRELILEAQRIRSLQQTQSKNDENPVEYIKAYIWEHLDQEISLNHLAQRVYLNPSYLSRLFRQAAGITITEYLTEARIQTARKLLLETDMKVQDIAKKIGIDSSAYFGRMFKKTVGCTPQEYRNRSYHRPENS